MPLEDYLSFNTELPDQFEPDTSPSMVFPCFACKHAGRPPEECEKCRHYCN